MTTTRAHYGDQALMPPFRLHETMPHDAVPYEGREGRQHCAYCGSLHPSEVVALLKAGAGIHFADWKYGWPHKAYLDNPWGKFYTRHLIDATPEDRLFIERRLGLHIEFVPETGSVSWRPVTPPPREPSPSDLFNGA